VHSYATCRLRSWPPAHMAWMGWRKEGIVATPRVSLASGRQALQIDQPASRLVRLGRVGFGCVGVWSSGLVRASCSAASGHSDGVVCLFGCFLACVRVCLVGAVCARVALPAGAASRAPRPPAYVTRTTDVTPRIACVRRSGPVGAAARWACHRLWALASVAVSRPRAGFHGELGAVPVFQWQ
jgi:hypothetical protein